MMFTLNTQDVTVSAHVRPDSLVMRIGLVHADAKPYVPTDLDTEVIETWPTEDCEGLVELGIAVDKDGDRLPTLVATTALDAAAPPRVVGWLWHGEDAQLDKMLTRIQRLEGMAKVAQDQALHWLDHP